MVNSQPERSNWRWMLCTILSQIFLETQTDKLYHKIEREKNQVTASTQNKKKTSSH